MFGRKKKIRELEKQIEVMEALMKRQPVAYVSSKDVKNFKVSINIEDFEPMTIVKHRLSVLLAEVILKNMQLDIDDENGRKVVRASVKIVE